MGFSRKLAVLALLLAATGAQAAQARALGGGLVGDSFGYEIRKGDSVPLISARFGIDQKIVKAELAGRLDPGTVIALDNRHIAPAGIQDGVVLNLPQRMLFLIRGGRVEASYPVAVGRPDWRTPTGQFRITSLERNKTWYVPPSIQREMQRQGRRILTKVPPGPDNPLGNRWIGLTLPGIGIHGTNRPASVYTFASHGCVRMGSKDIDALMSAVAIQDTVSFVYEPMLMTTTADGRIWLEVHPDAYGRAVLTRKRLEAMARDLGVTDYVDWEEAGRVLKAQAGLAREIGQVSQTVSTAHSSPDWLSGARP